MGPVTPLLAVVEAWRKKREDIEFVWIGTQTGPEQMMVEHYAIPFFSIPVARIPRYVSIEWLMFPFIFLSAFLKSVYLIRTQKPELILSAGGYTSVPVVIAGWLFRIPAWLHQQDAKPLLTSRVLSPFVDLITVAFEKTLLEFPKQKSHLLGNPVRRSMLLGSKERAIKSFGLDRNKQTVMVIGGGTGSTWLNHAIELIASNILEHANVIHLVGKGKFVEQNRKFFGYYVKDFLYEDMKDALSVADVVVSRSGMGSITELSALSKPTIFVPLPNSTQEDNVNALSNSVESITQDQKPAELQDLIIGLLIDTPKQERLGRAFHQALRTDVADELVVMLEQLVQK